MAARLQVANGGHGIQMRRVALYNTLNKQYRAAYMGLTCMLELDDRQECYEMLHTYYHFSTLILQLTRFFVSFQTCYPSVVLTHCVIPF
jgi:predicted GNAT superfamily acetyltransferase